MVKITALFLVSSIVTGCCTPEIRYQTIEVKVPVKSQCPIPKEIVKPILPVNDLTEKDIGDYEKVVKTYASSLNICMSYAEEQEEILNSYRKEITSGKKEETE